MLQQHVSLKPYNTFGIDVTAQSFGCFTSVSQLQQLLNQLTQVPLVLGKGSNILFTKPVTQPVLVNAIEFIHLLHENEDAVTVEVGAGVEWHQWVLYCLKQGWGGVENLSLIPGTVGAAPIQNIGAYGVEVQQVITQVTGWDIYNKQLLHLSNHECAFGYRDSIFKQQLKNKFIITSVTFCLSKQHNIQTTYGAIQQQLTTMGITQPTIQQVSEAVIAIRSSKLPNPAQVGNAGSFFKNPSIPQAQYLQLKQQYPNMPSYPAANNQVKVPAGWLIEQCGWKGYRNGDVGCYPLQALVLVNYGQATGQQVVELSQRIIVSVQQKFAITLQPEVNIY